MPRAAHSPIIAITMGDPAGIGPEIVAKTLAAGLPVPCRPVLVADPEVMERAARTAGTRLRFRPVADLAEAAFQPGEVETIQPEGLEVRRVQHGRVDAAAGKAAALCLQKAYTLAMGGAVDGLVSAPLNKQAFHLAGYHYFDELAFLADLSGSPAAFIAGVVGRLWTASVAEHVPFREIPALIRRERVLERIVGLHALLLAMGRDRPILGVAALNVHGGEGGLFGREEIDEIEPAIREARTLGIDAQGPVPADAVFVRALTGAFDGVIAMYHDQANIARKLQGRRAGATLFLGLPVPVGTTAHGTAFDIAGHGIADPGSLQMALECTARLASAGGPPGAAAT